MILLKTTTEIDQKMLDEGRVQILRDCGDDLLVALDFSDDKGIDVRAGYVSRYQIALAMMEQDG